MIQQNSLIQMKTPEGGVYEIGNEKALTIFAGPCAMESRDHALMTAERLKGIAERVGFNLVYKTSYDKANRTSIHSPRGVGIDKALPVFEDIQKLVGLLTNSCLSLSPNGSSCCGSANGKSYQCKKGAVSCALGYEKCPQ